jgi:hypothetical protein
MGVRVVNLRRANGQSEQVNDNTELFSGDTTGDNWSPTELGEGDWGLLVKMWRRGVDRTATQPEKTVFLPQLDITQEQNSSQVGQDARQTFNFASRTNEVYIIKGDKPGAFWGRA